MKWWHPFFAFTGAGFLRFYFKIMRIERFGFEIEKELKTERADILYSSWHRSFLFYAYHYRDHDGASIISQSKDGELIALVCKKLGITGFRGSSTRGGGDALHGLINFIKSGHIGGLTPDGPVGPPYESKPGIIQLAARTGSPLLAFACEANPSYELNTWDRTIIPLPFARIAMTLDREPFFVPDNLSPAEYEEYRVEFDKRMNRLSYQTRYYIHNNIKNVDPRDIPVPDNYLDYLPRRIPKTHNENSS